jgi:hypothetical protein
MRNLDAILVGAVLSAAGCAKAGPSDDDVSKAVAVFMTTANYMTLTNGNMSCGSYPGPVSEVTAKVTDRGEMNAKDAYWPVRTIVSGKCMSDQSNFHCGPSKKEACPKVLVPFTAPELSFALSKDDFGLWTAKPLER